VVERVISFEADAGTLEGAVRAEDATLRLAQTWLRGAVYPYEPRRRGTFQMGADVSSTEVPARQSASSGHHVGCMVALCVGRQQMQELWLLLALLSGVRGLPGWSRATDQQTYTLLKSSLHLATECGIGRCVMVRRCIGMVRRP
jgi:hypothetical protein